MHKMRNTFAAVSMAVLVGACMALLGGCATEPQGENAKANLDEQAQTTLDRFQRTRSNIPQLIGQSVGYVVFPSVGEGAVIVGGAYGRGVLYQGGQQVGYCDLKQGSIGLSLGGQTYAELIVFQDLMVLDEFKRGGFGFGVDATAVALKAGAAANATFKNGVVVFTMPNGGLMVDASVGGQKFTFSPK